MNCRSPWFRHAPLLAATRYYADAFPWVWMNFGPGIVAGFLGADVHSVAEPSETVWFTPARRAAIDEIEFTHDPDNIWWRRIKELTEAFIGRYGDLLAVSMTDLGGNIDILASFRGTSELLLDVMDQPEVVERSTSLNIGSCWVNQQLRWLADNIAVGFIWQGIIKHIANPCFYRKV